MQRSLTYQEGVNLFLLLLVYIVYESMTTLYLLLPPLLVVLYIYFEQAINDENYTLLTFVSIMLLFFEADHGYMLFSAIIYFTLLQRYLMPIIKNAVTCELCIKAFMALFIYLGYYLFTLLISYFFWTTPPAIDSYVLYYMIIEFIIISLLWDIKYSLVLFY